MKQIQETYSVSTKISSSPSIKYVGVRVSELKMTDQRRIKSFNCKW